MAEYPTIEDPYKVLARMRRTLNGMIGRDGARKRRITTLEAELREAREDKARLDWLQRNGGAVKHWGGSWSNEREEAENVYTTGLSLRAAIDKAREETG